MTLFWLLCVSLVLGFWFRKRGTQQAVRVSWLTGWLPSVQTHLWDEGQPLVPVFCVGTFHPPARPPTTLQRTPLLQTPPGWRAGPGLGDGLAQLCPGRRRGP